MSGRGTGYWRSIPVLVVAMASLALWGADAQAAIVGLERVAPNTPSNSTDKGITATCPAGKKLVGPGIDVTPGSGHVLVDDIRPSADLQSLFVRAREDETGTTANWYVQAFAICAYPPPGLERKTATSASDSSNKTLTVNCSSGKKLLGLAAAINSPNGQVLLEDLTPVVGLASATVKAVEDQTGNSGNWSLTAYAICASPITGLVRASSTSASDSSNPKLTNASCPVGKQVVGAGGNINTSNGQIVLDAVFADQTLTGTGFGAWEDDTGNTANWSLTAFAICASAAVRSAATVNSDVPEAGGFPPDGVAVATASCPSGAEVTGAGGEMDGARGEASMQIVGEEPLLETPPATTVDAVSFWDEDGIFNFNGSTFVHGSWNQTAYAICATPLPGTERVFTPSASDSSDKVVTASCPPGKQVVGGGGQVDGGFHIVGSPPDAAVFGEVVMDYLVPNAAHTAVTVAASEDETGFSGNWRLIAYAICATPPPGLQVVSASSALDSDELKSATASCPSGKNLLGTGAGIIDDAGDVVGGGQVVIDDLRPNAALTSVKVTGIEDQTGYGAVWKATAYAICANS